jgi:uncharacterized RDD family membrane protein YckC
MEDKTEENTEDIYGVQRANVERFFLASVWFRFFAYITDGIIVGSITFLAVKPILAVLGFNVSTTYWLSVFMVSSVIVGLAYYTWMTKVWGQTLGKMIFGLRVIRKDGRPLDWLTVIFREVIGKFISNFFGLHLGYIWSIFHLKKQAWHDQIGDTLVVYDKEVTYQRYVDINVQN